MGFKADMYPVAPGERAIVKWVFNATNKSPSSDSVRLPVPDTDTDEFQIKMTELLATGYVGVAIEMDGNDAYYQFEKHD